MDRKRTVEIYLSPKLGNMTAISFPAFSGLFAMQMAAAAAAPEEIPTSKPSSNANLLAISTASSLVTYNLMSLYIQSSKLNISVTPFNSS